jgi:hypothetical protein
MRLIQIELILWTNKYFSVLFDFYFKPDGRHLKLRFFLILFHFEKNTDRDIEMPEMKIFS